MKAILSQIVDTAKLFFGVILLVIIWAMPGKNDPDEFDPYY
jgi:hypothetical protein